MFRVDINAMPGRTTSWFVHIFININDNCYFILLGNDTGMTEGQTGPEGEGEVDLGTGRP
jgi:hypothetical protein